MKQLLAIGLLALSSCVVTPHTRLDTAWRGEVHPGVMSTISFDLDGNARWYFDLPEGTQLHELKYELDMSHDPVHLDITGFTSGPLAGKSLYGIAKWDDETMILDAEPGEAAEGSDAVRPKEFTDQARTFKRVR